MPYLDKSSASALAATITSLSTDVIDQVKSSDEAGVMQVLFRDKQLHRINKAVKNSLSAEEALFNIYRLEAKNFSNFFKKLSQQIQAKKIEIGTRFQFIVEQKGGHFATLDLQVMAGNKIRAFYIDSLGDEGYSKVILRHLKNAFKNDFPLYAFKSDRIQKTADTKAGTPQYRQIQYSYTGCRVFSTDFAYQLSKMDSDELYGELEKITANEKGPLYNFNMEKMNSYSHASPSKNVIKLFRGIQSINLSWKGFDPILQNQIVTSKNEKLEEAMLRRREILENESPRLIESVITKNIHIYYKDRKYLLRAQEFIKDNSNNENVLINLVNNAIDMVEIQTPLLFSVRKYLVGASSVQTKSFIDNIFNIVTEFPSERGLFSRLKNIFVGHVSTEQTNTFIQNINSLKENLSEKKSFSDLLIIYDQIAKFSEQLRKTEKNKYNFFIEKLGILIAPLLDKLETPEKAKPDFKVATSSSFSGESMTSWQHLIHPLPEAAQVQSVKNGEEESDGMGEAEKQLHRPTI